MEFRCRPYNSLLFFSVLGILLLIKSPGATAQCKGDFTYESFSPDRANSSGRIEITKANAEPGGCTYKVFKVETNISLVKTGETSSPNRIVIEGLPPGSYLIKIEWGSNCYKTLGGLEGILITRKEQ